MKKYIWFFIFFVTICNNFLYAQQFAQSPVALNLDYLISTYGQNATGTPESSAAFGRAAEINATGNLLLRSSQANINNRIADKLALDNDLHRVETWFKKRQTNRYYVNLEEWQKEEIRRLKREGSLTKEDIEYIYNRD